MVGGHNRGWALRAAKAALAAVAALALACGCAGPAPGSTTVPTFPTPAQRAGAPAAADAGAIPEECGAILAGSDLEALFGLPLGSVTVRTTIGVAEPSVGRTERVACSYTGAAPVGGGNLLNLNVSAYTDRGAADKQWRVNAAAEDGERRELPIGSASAVVVERPHETVLMVLYDTSNLTVVLPDRPLPGGRPRSDAAVDLALRVLPAVAAVPTAPPSPTNPSRAAGTRS
jgi:hypothetical protein